MREWLDLTVIIGIGIYIDKVVFSGQTMESCLNKMDRFFEDNPTIDKLDAFWT